MAAKRKGLGRGLDALLSGGKGASAAAATGSPLAGEGELRQLPVELVQRGRYQPRTHMDDAALDDLAASIRAHGVVQPITVRPLDSGAYEIVAGERRWRAAQRAGLANVPALVRDLPDDVALPIGIIENIQREDLNAVEEAGALKRLIDEFGLTHQTAADAVGRSRAAVSNLLRLLELQPDVLAMLERGDIEMGSARALLGLEAKDQVEVARTVAARGLSTRQTEHLVRGIQSASKRPRKTPARVDPDIQQLEQRLSEHLGTAVTLKQGGKGAGQLVIRYGSLDQLDGILGQLRLERS